MADREFIEEILIHLKSDAGNIKEGIDLIKRLHDEIASYEQKLSELNEGTKEFAQAQAQLNALKDIEVLLKASAQGGQALNDVFIMMFEKMMDMRTAAKAYGDALERLAKLEEQITTREEDMRRRAGILGADPAWRRVGFGLSRVQTFLTGAGVPPEIRMTIGRTSEFIRAIYGVGQVAAEGGTIIEQFKTKLGEWGAKFGLTATQFAAASAGIVAGVGAVIFIYTQLKAAYDQLVQKERDRLKAIREAAEEMSTMTEREAQARVLQIQQEMEAIRTGMEEMGEDAVRRVLEIADQLAGGSAPMRQWIDDWYELYGSISMGFLPAPQQIYSIIDATAAEMQDSQKRYEELQVQLQRYREALDNQATALNTQIDAIQRQRDSYLELAGNMDKLSIETIDETIRALETEIAARQNEIDALQTLDSSAVSVKMAINETSEVIDQLNEKLVIYRDYMRQIVAEREVEEAAIRASYDERVKMLDRARDEYGLQKSIRKLQEKAAEDEQKAIKESGEAIKKIWADFRDFEEQTRQALAEEDERFRQEKAKLDRQYMEGALDEWEKFYREQRQRFEEYALDRRHKEEDFLADMYEAAADNDVVRFKEIERQAERELRQMQEQFELEEKHKLEDFLAKRDEDRKQAAVRLADLQKEHEDRRAELLRALEEERAIMQQKVQAERNALRDRLAEIQLGLKKQIRELRDNYEEELRQQEWYNKKRADLEAGLQRQIEQIHIAYANRMATQLAAIYKQAPTTTLMPKTTTTTLSPTSFLGRTITALTSPTVNYTINATANVSGGVSRAEATSLLTQASREILSTVTKAYSNLSYGYGGGSIKMTKD